MFVCLFTYIILSSLVFTVLLLLIFSQSVDALVEESGCSLENLATTNFRMCVLAGNWKQVILYLIHTCYANSRFYNSFHIWANFLKFYLCSINSTWMALLTNCNDCLVG